MQLIDERDDLALALGDLTEDRLEALLELASVLGARHHGTDVESDHALVLERIGHIAGHDPLRKSLHDGRLAYARLPDEDGVVLGPPRQHLDHAADLVVTADDRVELAPPRQVGEIPAVALKRLVLLLRVRVGHPLAGRSEIGEHQADGGVLAQTQALGADIHRVV